MNSVKFFPRERFIKIRETLGMKKNRFAECLGISSSYVTQIESGEKEPSKPVIKLLILLFSVNKAWWETGKGEMFEQAGEPPPGIAEEETQYCISDKNSLIAKVAMMMADMDAETQKDICLSVEKEKLLRELLRQKESDKKAG